MNCDRGREIADAILYEGYILYPYRPSALKNQQRWTFGSVFPSQYGGDEISTMRTEILLYARPEASLDIVVRFLQPQRRQVQRLTSDLESQLYEPVPALDVDGQSYVSWDEAVEREISICDISLADVASRERSSKFALAAQKRDEAICSSDGAIAGSVTRTSEAVEGLVEISVTTPCDGMLQLRVTITNTTTLPELARCSRTAAQNFAFLSTHTLMYLRNGEFVSLLDPPTSLHEAAKGCDNQGTWPVLVGEEGKRDTILSSPIILYDYPKVAPESKGPFFDGAEIDEMLTLRVLTLTDDEKSEMAAADPQTRSHVSALRGNDACRVGRSSRCVPTLGGPRARSVSWLSRAT